ncbi:MAG: sigma-70 family RNA polymerase sigma factor [Deltaproteobacteria bacterium]|jgi:RNA polymerase sigma factor for flagellar operon FliA|nr:sigma-70 family RNA polymerase sigma factor [Deltaproteobacteria bacterium]
MEVQTDVVTNAIPDTVKLTNLSKINNLIENNIIFAKQLVNRFFNTAAKSGLDKEDIQSAAFWGLCVAAQKFNDTSDESFRGYAKSRIYGAMLDIVRREGVITKKIYDSLNNKKKKKFNSAETLENTNATPEPQKFTLPYSVLNTTTDFRRAAAILHELNLVVIPGQTLDVVELCYHCKLEPEDNQIVEEKEKAWKSILNKLSSKERVIVELHYLNGYSLEQIRKTYNVSKATVSRWHTKALDKLRRILEHDLDLLFLLTGK